jgi:hypothetical protein
LQRADAVGERASALLRRLELAAFAAGAVGAADRRRLGEDRFDRRVRAFERGGEPCHLGGDVVDALAQQRVLDPLGRPGRFRFALEIGDLALQLGALLDRGGELGVEVADSSSRKSASVLRAPSSSPRILSIANSRSARTRP